MSLGTEYSAVIFSKDLPQSSFLAESSTPLTASRFKNAPKTLFDELMDDNVNDLEIASKRSEKEEEEKEEQERNTVESQECNVQEDMHPQSLDRALKDTEESWKRIVKRLREENETLLQNLKSSHKELVKCQRDKSLLETRLQEQMEKTREAVRNSSNDTRRISRRSFEDKSVQVNNARRSLNDQNDTPLANQCRESEAEVQELEERLQYLSARRKQLLDEIDRMEEDVAAMQSTKNDVEEPFLSFQEEYRELYYEERQKRLDLVFQKRYLLLLNNSLEACERKTMNVLKSIGLEPRDSTSKRSLRSRARICFYVIIAIRRFQYPPRRRIERHDIA